MEPAAVVARWQATGRGRSGVVAANRHSGVKVPLAARWLTRVPGGANALATPAEGGTAAHFGAGLLPAALFGRRAWVDTGGRRLGLSVERPAPCRKVAPPPTTARYVVGRASRRRCGGGERWLGTGQSGRGNPRSGLALVAAARRGAGGRGRDLSRAPSSVVTGGRRPILRLEPSSVARTPSKAVPQRCRGYRWGTWRKAATTRFGMYGESQIGRTHLV